jgi:hypothetical protein
VFELNQGLADFMQHFLSAETGVEIEKIVSPKIKVNKDNFVLKFDYIKSDTETEKIEMKFTTIEDRLILNINSAGQKAFGMKYMNNLRDKFVSDAATREITKITIDKDGIHVTERDIVV